MNKKSEDTMAVGIDIDRDAEAAHEWMLLEKIARTREEREGQGNIYNPPHYTSGRQIEPIDVIEDWGMNYHISTAIKYLSRAGRKSDEIQDLKKASWYISRRISMLEFEESK
tara:strand:+ start:3944 stop:4279 length:336 start_codon:yes stop_codon:yes gene_type:complete